MIAIKHRHTNATLGEFDVETIKQAAEKGKTNLSGAHLYARNQMTTEHTPEPWSYGSFHRLLVVPIEDGHPNKHHIIADLGETEFPFNATLDSELRYNNARRIVACVNACAGISTETLESEGSASVKEK